MSEGKTACAAAQASERVERVAAGPLALAIHWRAGQVVALRLGRATKADARAALPPDASAEARAVQAALDRLAHGQPANFPPLPLAWERVPPFSRGVLQTLFDRVGFGQTVTYGELAALCGQPGKARAVGQAMARNPWPLIVPCHRVLGAGGALTGYTNPHGLSLKELLLEMESGRARS